ncbi:MAG TPA: hypothetical protein VMR45_03235 [Patescibacteria group bacterium]|nr:hypothetical protein [Patescibacteria group bacterium]
MIKCLACGDEHDVPAEVEPVVNITQEVIKVAAKIPETVVKTPGQILYEKHAAETGIKTQWKDFGQTQKDRYERKAAGTWTRKQSAKKPKPVRPEASFRGHDAKPALPPWSEIKDRSENIIIAWLEAVSCIK